MKSDNGSSCPTRAAHTRMAVRDWLETQARVTGYWRDLLLEAGDDAGLVEALDEHVRFLRAAALCGEGDVLQTQ